MNLDVAAKLVAALRSGNYKQGEHYLKVQDECGTRHCLAGVLCEVLGVSWTPKHGQEEVYLEGSAPSPHSTWVFYRDCVPSEQVREEAGIRRNWEVPPFIVVPDKIETARRKVREAFDDEALDWFSLNDYGMTFSELADFIEENAEEL